MADNLITTNITANADFTGLRTQLAATTAQLIKLQETTAGTNAKLANQIAVMNKAFATTLTSTGQFSQHFVSLTSDVEKFGKNLDRGRLKLSDYYNAWQGHTKKTSTLIRDLAKQQVMLQQAIVQPVGKNAQGLMQYNVMVAKGLDEVKNKMAIATQQAAIMNKVMSDGATQLINWGKNTQWAGRQLTVGLTVPLAAFGMAAQKAFRDADAELVRLTKVYGGLSATSAAELAKVRKDVSDTAREIAGSYGIAYKDTIALAADLAATGQQGNDLLLSTKETSRLAVLGEVDRQEAMKATLAIQNAFKQSTEELSESINFLNAVENQTSTSLADLVEAIPKAGPVIQSLGGDVQDLALYLTAMKEGGVNASEGANAIKSAMASLINPTKVAKEMFTGFGINIDQIVTSNAGNLTATIVELQSALDNLDPLSKSRAIEQLFGKFQYARMSALFENMGKEGSQTLQVMDLMKASAADLAGIADRELGMVTESASGKFKRALASVQADLAVVGDQFLRISTKILQVVDGIIKFFQKLPAPVKSFLTALGGLTAVAGPLIMLAGVMGNFIGYVIKGIFHLRQLVKGGQGFKLLTPEIIAADAAAKGLASTFYSDTEATVVLTNAVNALTNSFALLETKAASAAVKVQPGISTVAGTVLAAGGYAPRVVDKTNPLVGEPYSRDMSHLTPSGTSQMGTIFGTVPGSAPVNVRIGKNPQAYMDSDLPRIPGVTSVNGISTGIVSQEAAKWHAMTAAIAMQSEAELKLLKAEVMSTGTVTSSLSDSYQALLPQFTEITSLAAQETAAIVQQLQQSKITVDQARAKILQLNATVEAMLAETATLTAAGMGRTVNLTTVPLTTQPVVDPATGKSNMKEMFHKGSVKEMADRIARALGGVRTSGAGYNIETTKPKFAKGGIVPGTGNTDTYHTTAEPGAFVINKAATEANMPIIENILGGTPIFRNAGGQVPVVLTPGEAVIPANFAQSNMSLMYELNGGPGNTSGMGRNGGGATAAERAQAERNIRGASTWASRMEVSENWLEEKQVRHVINDAAVLNELGMSEVESIKTAKRHYDEARRYAYDPKTDKIDDARWAEIRERQAKELDKRLGGKLLRPMPVQVVTSRGVASGRTVIPAILPSPSLLDTIGKMGFSSPTELVRIREQLFGQSVWDPALRKWIPATHSYASEHDIRIGQYGYRAAGNYGQAIAGNKEINQWTATFSKLTGNHETPFVDRIPSTPTEKQIALDTVGSVLGVGKGPGVAERIIAAPERLKYNFGITKAFMSFLMSKRPGKMSMSKQKLNAGGSIAQKLFGGGKTMFLGMPRTIKQVEAQRAAKIAMEKASEAAKNSRYGKEEPIQYGELLEPTSGRSFPVPGIGGVYSRNGERVFVKPMLDEKAALAEMRATEIARSVHGLHAPKQKIVVMKDPTDPTGKRNLLALESKYDKTFAEQDGTFTDDQYFRQLVASALRGDKDLGRGNLSGNILADVGTAGVFSTASGLRDYSGTMPSFKHQAMINLMGVKGSGAKKFFAESTAGIPKGMTADQYNDRMLEEINRALPKLKETIARFPDLNTEEKVVYNAMIKRLSDARRQTYGDLHGIHSSLKIAPERAMTPAAIAKMMAADELKRRQKGHSVSLSDNDFKTPENGFILGGLVGAITKGKAMHRIGAGFGKDSTGGWGVTSLEIGMAEKLFASTGLTKRTQRIFYDKLAANLAKEMPYGYTKNAQGHLIKALEPDVMDTVIKSAASDALSAAEGRKVLSQIDREILRKKFANWDSKKDTPLTEALKKLIFNLEGREKGGPVNSGQPYIVGEKGPEIFVPRNAGGIIPNSAISTPPQGLILGGGVLAQTAIPAGAAIGAQMIAQKVANPIAQMIIQQIGFILPMIMMNQMMMSKMQGGAKTGGIMSKIPASMTTPIGVVSGKTGGLTKYGAGLDKMANSGKTLPTMLSKIGFAATRLNVGLAVLTTAVMVGKNRWDAYKESMRLNALGYGMTAESAEKAGLKFTDYNKKIKDAISDAKALRETNRLIFESRANSGTALNITVAEFKKLKKEAKDIFKDQVALINKTSADDQEELAIRLKQQFIAMGMSAEEASKKIYAMYAVSKFAGSAAEYTVASAGFNSIKTSIDAAVGALRTYNDAVKNKLDPTEQANAFNTALIATEAAIAEAEDKAMKARQKEGAQGKKLKFISQSEREDISFAAEQEALDKITRTVGSQEQLGEELVEELKKQNPELDKLVNKYDTNLSVFQKMRIVAKGFTGDLSKLNAAQTNAVYQLQAAVSNAVANENRNGMLKKQYESVDNLRKLQDKYEKAAKGQKVSQQIADREKLSALQKQIDANNKLADARIKALTAAKEENDLGREIAKKKAEYDAALATGDVAGAQVIGMDLQGLESQLQFNSQVKAIEQSRDQANAPLIKQIEAMQKKQQALADAAALAGEKLGDVSKAIDKQEGAIDKLNSTMSDYRLQLQIHKDDLGKWKESPEAQALLASIAAAAEAARVDLKGLGIEKNAAGKYDATAGQQLFDKIAGGLETSLLKDGLIVNGDLIVNGKKIDIGAAATSKAALADPTKVAGKTTGEGKDKKYFDDAGNVVTEKEYKSMPVGAPSDGKEYVVPILGMNNREFINRDSARREFFGANNNKGQYETEDGFKFMANGSVTKNGKTVGSWLAALPGSTKVKSYYTGSIGAVRGEGTATSDSIPAYLSNGEYVVRASAVSQYGVPFMDALNAEKLYKGGQVGDSIPKFGFGGWVKSGFKKMPQIMGSAAIWQTMEEIEKLLSLKYGADKKDSGLEKWSKAFGRVAFNTAQGGLSGLTFGGAGGLAGVAAGLVEGLVGLKNGSQYGVKGGSQSGVKGFNAKNELNNMSVLGSLGKVAETAGLSVPFGFAGNKIAPKISAMINKFKTKPASSMPVSESIPVGSDTYNTFSIGKDKFAFKGLESSSKGRYGSVVDSDLSALTSAVGSLSVVPTTPQGLIQAALKLKPNDKALMDLLDGFKSKKYGDSQTELLDLMIASSYIDQDGKLLSDINTEGLALVISHLAGDKNATTILKSKKTVLDSLLAKEKAGATTGSNPSRFEHALEPDQVPVIHSTKHGLSYDPSGNIEIRPAGYYRVGEGQLPKGAGDIDTAAVARPTIHTALYGTVADHIYSQWDTANKKIVSTLGAMIGANGNPQSLNPIDTWWSRSPGESLLFPKDKTAIISPFTNEADYVKELIKRGIIKQGEPHPIVVSDPNSNEILQLSKSQYSNSELEEIAELVYREAAQKVVVKDGQLVTESRSLGETLYHKLAEPAEYLDRVALQLAKQKLNIEGGPVYVDGWGLSSPYANQHVAAIADNLKVPQLQHSQSAQQSAESAEYFSTSLRERGDYAYSDPINIDSLRYLALSGHYPTPKTTGKKPSFDDDDFDIWDEDVTRGATGGLLKGGKIRIPGYAGGAYVNPTYSANMSIPKFETGINSVPADMLAMLHKNEAVIPANMNPFNPNANNATMGGATFNITNNINGFDGDINQLSRMVTQQTVSAIKSLDGRTASMAGPNLNVGIN
jgi:TP901 family phage tail tape measure protein